MKVDVDIRGMHCAGCVQTVEEAVRQVGGVREANVNFASERATLEIDPGSFQAPALQQALRDRGYRALLRRHVWQVKGLDPSGVAAVESRLRSLPGVAAAAVNYATGTVAADLLFEVDVEGFLRREGLEAHPEEIQGRDTELRDLAIRTGVALGLAGALMTLSMLHRGPPWLGLLLAFPVQFWCGWGFHSGFLRSLGHLRADMNALISIGTNAAFFASVAAKAPYYETSATIIAIVLLGRLLELRARRGSRRAVEALLELAPAVGVKPGDIRTIKPGERFPADGVLTEGAGAVDESMLTGESDPVDKKPGDRVIGGTLNRTGALTARFDRTGEDTILAGIVRRVRQSQGSKPPVQRLADLWAGRFVPIVLGLAAVTLGAWLLLDRSYALQATVAVLIVACPCAFGLATPMAVVVAVGRAARLGILFKDAPALEGIAKLERLVFDKTGTLTQGRPGITSVVPAEGFSKDDVLRLAGAVERLSEHPLAQAIAQAAPSGPPATGFDARPGLGALAQLDGHELAVGSRAFFARRGINFAPLQHDLTIAVAHGETAVLVARDGALAGLITLSDQPRAESARVVRELGAMGLAVSMLTGDDGTTAGAVAEQLGIKDVKAEVLPEDKAQAIQEMQAHGPIGMVGDGINDAPALAQADVGIAVHQGTDVAIESADVILMKNDLGRVVTAVRLGRRARRVIHQNFAWAFRYNLVLIPLAAGLFRKWGLTLDPMVAAVAMALSSISVVANSLRL
ncbi:MAG TPA: heavy metal translocating P-type ATPase, partial [Planctomycetota bacterium]|nr:heavy metal translocating P-type ATPase [Planctomycetota bacterium]